MGLEKTTIETSLKKQYVLGRKDKKTNGLLNIGRYYALDSSLGSEVYIDILRPHITLICGKRGYGKSYTMGVFLEEIAKLEKETRDNLGVIVIDTLGIFWTSIFPNNEKEKLKQWNITPQGTEIQLFVPKKQKEEYNQKGINAQGFSVNVSDLSPFHWCQLFNVKHTDPIGIAITRSVQEMQQKTKNYSINDLLKCIKQDKKTNNEAKSAAENFLKMAESWEIFDQNGIPVTELISRGNITVLDVSCLPGSNLKSIITAIIGEKIFEERVKERKNYELRKMGKETEKKGMPMVWMAIDEAQLFLPNDSNPPSKKVFINEWMRQGRQPGLSLIMATQRPSSLESEVMSHSDIVICHRLTAQEDIDALSRIRPTYMHGSIKEAIKKIGDEKGVAFILDDTSESTHVIKIRPRLSWHGGAEPTLLEPE